MYIIQKLVYHPSLYTCRLLAERGLRGAQRIEGDAERFRYLALQEIGSDCLPAACWRSAACYFRQYAKNLYIVH